MTSATPNRTGCARPGAAARISSLLKKPAKSGIPAMARVPDEEGPEGPGDLRPQAAHLPHVLLAATCAWITEPEPRKSSALKKAWVKRWKTATPKAPTPAGQEHVAELAHRGVGQHLLDVVLDEGDGRGHERGGRAHHRHHQHRGLGLLEERAEARHHVDAGRDHGRGVDEGARPGSGLPSRRAARRAAGSARSCRRRPTKRSRQAIGHRPPAARAPPGRSDPALSAMSTRSRLPKAW